MNKKESNNLYFYYDQEADVLYLSSGKPSARDRVTEAGDDVLLRTSPATGQVRGITILNVGKRTAGETTPVYLPVKTRWTKSANFSRHIAHL